jgi:hypothetical protein
MTDISCPKKSPFLFYQLPLPEREGDLQFLRGGSGKYGISIFVVAQCDVGEEDSSV